jgi:hypothetical protein
MKTSWPSSSSTIGCCAGGNAPQPPAQVAQALSPQKSSAHRNPPSTEVAQRPASGIELGAGPSS